MTVSEPVSQDVKHPGPEASAAAPEETSSAPAAGAASPEVSGPPALLPLLPLRHTVVFPGTMTPLQVGRPDSLRMIDECLPSSKYIGLVSQKDSDAEKPDPSALYDVGVLARVIKLIRQGEEGVVLLVQSLERIRLLEIVPQEGFFKARFEQLESRVPPAEDEYWQAGVANLRESAVQLIELSPNLPDEARQAVLGIENPELLADFLASNLSLEPGEKQKLLEETDVLRRFEALQRLLNNQLHIAQLQKQLRDDMQTEFGEAQKRAYLREQLRHIQKELGEGDGSDEQLDSLRSRIEKAQLPEKAKEHAERELRRLSVIPSASPEHSVIVTYLETLAELPWNIFSEDQLDLPHARSILERDHHGLTRVKKRILEYLAVRRLNPEGRGPILCFLGPPGVGKTSLGQSIADALGRKFTRISVGGLRDEAEIRGHRRTYIGSMPGRLIQEIRRAGTRNPVVMLDEVDKIGADFRGDPASALLEVLDPRQNHSFVDRYLDVPFDLSQIIFIATANTIDPVPPPLRDRMEIIEIPGYTEQEKLHIARGYLVPRQLQENGLTAEQCQWQDDALRLIIEEYTREAGVRNLEREIGSVTRHIAAAVAAEERESAAIGPALVGEALGPPRFVREDRLHLGKPGVVNGLAYTPVGGEVLHIEALRYPGTGKITLTGHLGEVMKESVQAAMSLVRSRCAALGIDCDAFPHTDVHVHVPAGAIPKDGPSAGVAMFTALASLFSDRPVRPDVAMTGEISLRGLILPIGGLKEKTLAALRDGIRTVLIPALNEKDLPELPAEARQQLEIIPVRTIDEVLPIVLEPAVSPA